MKKFTNYIINESLSESVEPKLDDDVYLDINKKLLDMLEESINSNDAKLAKTFISKYLEDSEANYIVGLVNDSDIYDFYIKFIDVIDQILLEKEFFTKPPSDMNISSVYKYIIKATRTAVNTLLKKLQSKMQ